MRASLASSMANDLATHPLDSVELVITNSSNIVICITLGRLQMAEMRTCDAVTRR